MNGIVRRFFQRWLVDTVAVSAATLLPGIEVDRWPYLILAAIVLGIVNTFVRPVLMLLALPLIFLTLGLFIFVINALMLLLVDRIIPGFHVHGIGSALGGALIITIVSILMERVIGKNKPSKNTGQHPGSNSRRGPPPGSGPVIDV